MVLRSCSLFFIIFCVVSAGAQTPLRTFADGFNFNFGVTIGSRYDKYGTEYNDILKSQFNTIVCENEMKLSWVQSVEGTFDFTGADKLVSFATQNNMKIRGHCLVWDSQAPDWLKNGTWTRETLLAAMKTHIDTVMTHLKGQCFEWDVVNEAFLDDENGSFKDSFWEKTIGRDYIDSAFVYAHAADPDAILYYNEYGTNIKNAKSDAVYNKLKSMLENGIPVHGVGFQSHLAETDCYDGLYNDTRENFKRFADLGLKIAITELDVKINLPADSLKLVRQAHVFGATLRAALATPECNSFIIWGFTDKHSWIPYSFPGYGDGLFYDSSCVPKPAFDTLYKIMSEWKVGVQRNFSAKRQAVNGLEISNLSNNIIIHNVNLNRPAVLELYDLRGLKTGTFNIAAGEKRSFLDMVKSRKTVIVKVDNKATVLKAVR